MFGDDGHSAGLVEVGAVSGAPVAARVVWLATWAGVSGAGVFAHGLLIAVIVVDERGGYSGDRLSAVPSHRLAADTAFVAAVIAAGGGLQGPRQVESVELAGLLTPLHPRPSRRGPGKPSIPGDVVAPGARDRRLPRPRRSRRRRDRLVPEPRR